MASATIKLDVKIEYYLDKDGSFWVDILIGENHSKAIIAKPNEKDAEGNIYTVESIEKLYMEFMERERNVTVVNLDGAIVDKVEGTEPCCGGCCSC